MNELQIDLLSSMASMFDKKAKKTITKKQYEEFKKEFIFDKLKGYTLGQSFCKKFEISDYMLSNVTNDEESEFLIETLGYIK